MNQAFVCYKPPFSSEVVQLKGSWKQLSRSWNFDDLKPGFCVSAWPDAAQLWLLEGTVEPYNADNIEGLLERITLDDCGEPTSKIYFKDQVTGIQQQIQQLTIEKAVAWRKKTDLRSFSAQSVLQWFEILCREHSSALVSLMYHPQFGLWIGASPETLVRYEHSQATIMSLAGTLIHEHESWTPKEQLEQTVTSKHIQETLLKWAGVSAQTPKIQEYTSGKLRHLMSEFSGEIAVDNFAPFIRDLSPTPAVGGYPSKVAQQWLNATETQDRELFTGFWGFQNAPNQLHWFVNLRCAQIRKNGVEYYAGCGINLGSNWEKEWQETEAKMNVIREYYTN